MLTGLLPRKLGMGFGVERVMLARRGIYNACPSRVTYFLFKGETI